MSAIDLHTHFVAPDLLDFLRREGASYDTRVVEDERGEPWFVIKESARRPAGPRVTAPARRLRDMDRQGVQVHVLSCPPFLLYPEVEPAAGLAIAQLANDTLADTVKAQPARFAGFATVPLQAPDLAARELERAVRSLGLRGVQIGTQPGAGCDLDDAAVLPFWEAAASLSVPVALHPFDAAPGGPLARYYLGNLVGNPVATAVAAALLIYGGVLERFPSLRVVLYHAGGAFPSVLGRLDRGYQVRPECRAAIPRPPSSYVDQLAFDTIAHDAATLAQVVARFGAERVLLGSDYPFDMGLDDPVASVRSLELPAAAMERILTRNAEALLGVQLAAG